MISDWQRRSSFFLPRPFSKVCKFEQSHRYGTSYLVVLESFVITRLASLSAESRLLETD